MSKMEARKVLALFELLESSSSSSDEENELLDIICQIVQHTRGKRRCVRNFHEEAVHTRYEFIGHYRVSPELCDSLVSGFEESKHFPKPNRGGDGKKWISAKKHILCFLWYVGHTANSFRSIVERFDLTKDSFSHILSRVNSFLFDLSAQVIKWPSDVEMDKSDAEFGKRFGTPDVFGCIASVHIKINAPALEPEVYLNKRGKHSIQMQAICDHEGKFLDVFLGCPGSAHQATVLENSLIYEKLPELCKDKHLLGNEAYPLKTWLLTPYPDHNILTQTQKDYNSKLSSAQLVIETVVSAIKRRFPILWLVPLRRESEICRTILSCCVIHNMANVEDLEVFHDEVDSDADIQLPEYDPHDASERNSDSYLAALRLRDQVAEGTKP